MRCSANSHPLYGGIALHARRMSVCLMPHDGARLLHRPMTAAPAPCLQAMAPSRDGLVGAVAGLCTWYGLADLCADAGLACVRSHALSRQARHGGTAKNDTSDAHTIAALPRGGRRPQASVSPAERRATRDRLRRRPPLRRTQAALLAHGQPTNRPTPLPELGQKIASKANRPGVAERFDEAARCTRTSPATWL